MTNGHRKRFSDFPGGTVDRNPSANSGDTGSIPGLGRFNMPWSNQVPVPQLLKPARLEPVLCNKRSHPPKALDKVAFLQSKGVVGYNKKKN